VNFPLKGRIIPEVRKDYYRETFVFTYRIMYKISDKKISILAIHSMRRNLNVNKIKDLKKD
jgi:hypothetical protein